MQGGGNPELPGSLAAPRYLPGQAASGLYSLQACAKVLNLGTDVESWMLMAHRSRLRISPIPSLGLCAGYRKGGRLYVYCT